MTVERERANVRLACEAMAPLAMEHELVISHGNGPQVGLLALQASAYDQESTYPFDVLGAQTEGMIGYLIEQELGNLLPFDKQLATVLTMVEVDPDDPAMADPTKFVGPVYGEADARHLAAERGWTVKQDGAGWRRVVPSPVPRRIFEIGPIRTLLDSGVVVICTGGGGIPTMYLPEEEMTGRRIATPARSWASRRSSTRTGLRRFSQRAWMRTSWWSRRTQMPSTSTGGRRRSGRSVRRPRST